MKTNTGNQSGDKPPDDPKQSEAFIKTAAELVGADADGAYFLRAIVVVQAKTGTLTQKNAAGTIGTSATKKRQ